jgi:hypothetical protein
MPNRCCAFPTLQAEAITHPGAIVALPFLAMAWVAFMIPLLMFCTHTVGVVLAGGFLTVQPQFTAGLLRPFLLLQQHWLAIGLH